LLVPIGPFDLFLGEPDSFAKVRSLQVGSFGARPLQAGFAEPRSLQVGSDEARSPQICSS
jgi:hypothetical protein